jgi:ribosomal-protein-alanine N-acetyltransferase
MLTPQDMARINAAAHPNSTTGFEAADFEKLLKMPNIVAFTRPEGYLIFRVAGLEADIHSFTIAPEHQNKGVGTDMLRDALEQLHDRGVKEVFLEVDTDNLPAQKLYHKAGFYVVGDRPEYYRNPDGTVSHAYTMAYYYGKEDLIGAIDRYRLPL